MKPNVISAMFLLSLMIGCSGPVGPFPGGKLSGDLTGFPLDWRIAENIEQIQLETYDTDAAPHSVNIWCVVVDNRLFFATSLVRGEEQPQNRQWVQNALAERRAKVRIGRALYSGELNKVVDPKTVAAVKSAFVIKYNRQPDQRTDNAWIFELAKTTT